MEMNFKNNKPTQLPPRKGQWQSDVGGGGLNMEEATVYSLFPGVEFCLRQRLEEIM